MLCYSHSTPQSHLLGALPGPLPESPQCPVPLPSEHTSLRGSNYVAWERGCLGLTPGSIRWVTLGEAALLDLSVPQPPCRGQGLRAQEVDLSCQHRLVPAEGDLVHSVHCWELC